MNLCNYCTMVDYDTAPRAFTKHLMWKHTQHRVCDHKIVQESDQESENGQRHLAVHLELAP